MTNPAKTKNNSMSLDDFPISSCGNLDKTESDYVYPVFVKYSDNNLSSVRKDFCKDAFKKSDSDIQVASLNSEESANQLRSILVGRFEKARVGDRELK